MEKPLIPPACESHLVSIEDTDTHHYKQLICHDCRAKKSKLNYKWIRWLTPTTYHVAKLHFPENIHKNQNETA
jgi:hypothetical protein